MNNKRHMGRAFLLLAVMLVWVFSMTAMAGEGSDDNSLSSLGILTEGAEVSPEFSYGTVEYNVTVPAGTKSLSLDPVPTNSNAWIVDISGTELVDGKATVVITVSAQNGNQYSYYLYVTADGDAVAQVETEPETEAPTEPETEPETEDPRYVKVDRNTMEEAENTISSQKAEINTYRDKVGMLTKILYGMIALCVILLFVVINLILKKRDLKEEVEAYRSYGYTQDELQPAPKKRSGKKKKAGTKQPEEETVQEPYAEMNYGNQDYGYSGYDAGYETGPGYQAFDSASSQQPYSAYDEITPSADEGAGKKQKKQKKSKAVKDDPATVPKPAKAKVQRKQMPQYQQPEQPYEYQEPAQGSDSKNVEVTMIDL